MARGLIVVQVLVGSIPISHPTVIPPLGASATLAGEEAE